MRRILKLVGLVAAFVGAAYSLYAAISDRGTMNPWVKLACLLGAFVAIGLNVYTLVRWWQMRGTAAPPGAPLSFNVGRAMGWLWPPLTHLQEAINCSRGHCAHAELGDDDEHPGGGGHHDVIPHLEFGPILAEFDARARTVCFVVGTVIAIVLCLAMGAWLPLALVAAPIISWVLYDAYKFEGYARFSVSHPETKAFLDFNGIMLSAIKPLEGRARIPLLWWLFKPEPVDVSGGDFNPCIGSKEEPILGPEDSTFTGNLGIGIMADSNRLLPFKHEGFIAGVLPKLIDQLNESYRRWLRSPTSGPQYGEEVPGAIRRGALAIVKELYPDQFWPVITGHIAHWAHEHHLGANELGADLVFVSPVPPVAPTTPVEVRAEEKRVAKAKRKFLAKPKEVVPGVPTFLVRLWHREDVKEEDLKGSDFKTIDAVKAKILAVVAGMGYRDLAAAKQFVGQRLEAYLWARDQMADALEQGRAHIKVKVFGVIITRLNLTKLMPTGKWLEILVARSVALIQKDLKRLEAENKAGADLVTTNNRVLRMARWASPDKVTDLEALTAFAGVSDEIKQKAREAVLAEDGVVKRDVHEEIVTANGIGADVIVTLRELAGRRGGTR